MKWFAVIFLLTSLAFSQKNVIEGKENSIVRMRSQQCIQIAEMYGGGEFCVWTSSPIHLSQIITGDVWIWSDDGHVWPIWSPDRREWWEKARPENVDQ